MTILNRKDFLKWMSAGVAAVLLEGKPLQALPASDFASVNFIIPRDYRPYTDDAYAARLKRAVLETLQTHYTRQNMPVWRKRFTEVDMETRIHWIVYWLMSAIREHERVYPVDPALVLAMVMKESYFYEYAVSSALAVGICQFIQPTAQEYQMLCAGTLPEHGRSPYRLAEYANNVAEYYRLRQVRREYYRNERPSKRFTQREALRIIAENQSGQYSDDVRRYLNYLERLDEIDRQRSTVRDQFREYLRANVEHRNLFDRNDLSFILGFDERFTYKKPLSGMVLMLARNLRARNGNVLAAAIGFNAGLSTTQDIGRFEPYGKIPFIEESVQYISHVLVNYHEFTRRL